MALDPSARQHLDAVAEALVDEWRVFVVDATSQAEVATRVAEMVARVVDIAEGREAGEPENPSPLARRVVTLLRRRVIDSSGTLPPEATTILLQAIERVAESLEASWSNRFQDRMTGPSGLDLVVEVAHDLRSPLTSILFLAETMMRGRSGPLTPLQERQLGLVYSAAFGLNTVASDVIELVRGGDRLVGRDQQAFSVTEVLDSVRDIVLPIAEEKGLQMHFEGPADDLRQGHPGALNRVLLNLSVRSVTRAGGFPRRRCRRCMSRFADDSRRAITPSPAQASGCRSAASWWRRWARISSLKRRRASERSSHSGSPSRW